MYGTIWPKVLKAVFYCNSTCNYFINIFFFAKCMSLYVLSITSHFLANTRSIAIFIKQFSISFWVTGILIEKLTYLDHPSVNSEKDGMQKQSPHDTSVIHPHCFLFDWRYILIDCAQTISSFILPPIKVVSIWGIRHILLFAHALRLALLYLLCNDNLV